MIMMLFRNREFRLFTIVLTAVWIAASLFFIFTTMWWWQGLSTALIDRDTAVVGKLAANHPGLEKEIVEAFTTGPSQDTISKGREVLTDYYYLPEHSREILNLPAYFYFILAAGIPFCLTIFSGILFLCGLFSFKRIYRHLHGFSAGIDKIVGGNYDIRFQEGTEGEIAILGFQINQMAVRIKLLLEKLEEEKEFFKSMMSNISHQIKTPLASIGVYNEILEEDGEKEEIRAEFLQRNKKLVARIDWLVQTLLKYSKLRTGSLLLDREETGLDGLINRLLTGLEPLWKSKGQNVSITGTKGVSLFIDPAWFSEALENIIKNAVDYTPEGGAIRLSVGEDDTLAYISVEDSGPGIAQEELKNVFIPFYRGMNESRGGRPGTGLGLSLAKLVVEKHNGYIKVKSTSGRGTTFQIVLPKEITRLQNCNVI